MQHFFVSRIYNFCIDLSNTTTAARAARSLLGTSQHTAFCPAFAGFLRIGESTYSIEDRGDPDSAQWFLTGRSVGFGEKPGKLSQPASNQRQHGPTAARGGGLELSFRSANGLFVWPHLVSFPPEPEEY